VRSWIAAEGLGDRVAWVSVGRGEHDPVAFWLSVLDSLRGTRVGSGRVRELTAAPDLDGATVVRRLLDDVGALDERVWLLIDDPPQLRVVLLTRRDLQLGLHRLRLEGELTEIRGEDLRFTLEESRALLDAAGVRVSDGALESLVGTTEGWAAGLRLAALSLAGDPDPEHLAPRFSGRERAVADYLLARCPKTGAGALRSRLRSSGFDKPASATTFGSWAMRRGACSPQPSPRNRSSLALARTCAQAC
jgi:LuxR family maltose regulon positive regulatory protein